MAGQFSSTTAKKKLEIVDIKGKEVKCKIIVGGDIKGRRGQSAGRPSVGKLHHGKRQKGFGIWNKNKVDFVALSFVRRPDDIIELKYFK